MACCFHRRLWAAMCLCRICIENGLAGTLRLPVMSACHRCVGSHSMSSAAARVATPSAVPDFDEHGLAGTLTDALQLGELLNASTNDICCRSAWP